MVFDKTDIKDILNGKKKPKKKKILIAIKK